MNLRRMAWAVLLIGAANVCSTTAIGDTVTVEATADSWLYMAQSGTNFGTADPRYYQIRHVRMPCRYLFSPPFGRDEPYRPTIAPGYLAISATHLQGVWATEAQRQARRRALAESELVDRIGYSLFVYRVPGPRGPGAQE